MPEFTRDHARPARRWRLLGAPLALLLGCGSGDPTLTVEVRDSQGRTPLRYRAVFAEAAGVRRLTCPSSQTEGPLRCTPSGVVLSRAEPGDALTLKAPGFVFETFTLREEQLRDGRATLQLEPLAPFQNTASHLTGVTAEAGEAAWLDLSVPTDGAFGRQHSVKFYIDDLQTEPRVYFQNTRVFPRHYDFVVFGLGLPLSPAQFEQRTYRGENRSAMAGTLIYSPERRSPSRAFGGELLSPLSLEFFPSDDLTPDQALLAHRLIEERLQFLAIDGPTQRLIYVPAGSRQESELASAATTFQQRDALFSDHAELYAGLREQILNPGLAYGTLRVFTPEELSAAVVSRRDLVVLTRLPNDLPLVGGTITEELQTPLSHVNLAARARGTPNIALRDASRDSRIAPWVGELVRFEVTAQGFTLQAASVEEAQAHWDADTREPWSPESDLTFDGLPSFEELSFADSIRVGSKAANLAELRRVLGEQAPLGFAVPFSAFRAYMQSNELTESRCAQARTACEQGSRAAEICATADSHCQEGAQAAASFEAYLDRLLSDPDFDTDTALREACLAGFRHMISRGEVEEAFAAALDARVLELFGSSSVRLRSSTNAEDLEEFSGAGLYESVSAEASGERRAGRRIREVWASVYTWKAFEERQYWKVEQRAVNMGVAVNQAVPRELANGVLLTQNPDPAGNPGMYVNVQWGEVSVTNPGAGILPEVFFIVPAPGGDVQAVHQRFSPLSPDQPILSQAEVRVLFTAAERVQAHFAPLYGRKPSELNMDIEFKIIGPERALWIKQARPYLSRNEF